MHPLRQDLRYAARRLVTSPGFTAVAVITLALGIGANTAIFSIVDAVLLRPLPYAHADQLLAVWGRTDNDASAPVTPADFADWRTQNHAFEDLAAMSPADFNLTGAGEPERIAGGAVKDLPIYDVNTMRERLTDAVTQPRFRTLLLGLFAGIALVLAAVGIFGVMSYSVTQRTQEIGVRMALGAGRREVVWLVVRQAMLLTVTGVAVGLLAASARTRLLTSLLFEVSATDPAAFLAISLFLAAVALLAYLPARRATRVDPMVALRYE